MSQKKYSLNDLIGELYNKTGHGLNLFHWSEEDLERMEDYEKIKMTKEQFEDFKTTLYWYFENSDLDNQCQDITESAINHWKQKWGKED